MPSADTIDRFIEQVENGKFIEAMEAFYSADATVQENTEPPRIGLPALLANERKTLAAFKQATARSMSPALISGDRVVIHWEFIFQHASRAKLRFEELALQTWRGDKLASERFFYDSRQLRP